MDTRGFWKYIDPIDCFCSCGRVVWSLMRGGHLLLEVPSSASIFFGRGARRTSLRSYKDA